MASATYWVISGSVAPFQKTGSSAETLKKLWNRQEEAPKNGGPSAILCRFLAASRGDSMHVHPQEMPIFIRNSCALMGLAGLTESLTL